KRDRRVRLNLYRAGISAENPGDVIADLGRHLPPARGPCVFTGVLLPGVVIGQHRIARNARHWPETVTQKVNPRNQRRELFAAAIDLSFEFHRYAGILPALLFAYAIRHECSTASSQARPDRSSILPGLSQLLRQSADRSIPRECAAGFRRPRIRPSFSARLRLWPCRYR